MSVLGYGSDLGPLLGLTSLMLLGVLSTEGAVAQESKGGAAPVVVEGAAVGPSCITPEALSQRERAQVIDEREARTSAISAMGVTVVQMKARQYSSLLGNVEGQVSKEAFLELKKALPGQEVEIQGKRYGLFQASWDTDSSGGMYRDPYANKGPRHVNLGQKGGVLHLLRDSDKGVEAEDLIICGQNPCSNRRRYKGKAYAVVAVLLEEGQRMGEELEVIYPRKILSVSYEETILCMPGPTPP